MTGRNGAVANSIYVDGMSELSGVRGWVDLWNWEWGGGVRDREASERQIDMRVKELLGITPSVGERELAPLPLPVIQRDDVSGCG
jgi:hypothetical protein